MVTPNEVTLRVNLPLTANELFTFYLRNDICEVGFGKETAARILEWPHLIVAAFDDQGLVGLARATFDGLSAHVMEFSLDLRYQGGEQRYANGSLLEADERGGGVCSASAYCRSWRRGERPSSRATLSPIAKSRSIKRSVSVRTPGMWSTTLTSGRTCRGELQDEGSV